MMRIKLIIISLFTSYFSVAGISIKGEISNTDKNRQIYIYEYLVNQINVKDSSLVKNGEFSFKYKNLTLGKYKLGFSRKTSQDIILGDEDLTIKADYTNYKKSFTVKNSTENEAFNNYQEIENKYKKQSDKINLKARQIKYNAPDRNEKLQALQIEFDSLTKIRSNELQKLAKNNVGTYTAINANYVLSLSTIPEEDFYKKANVQPLQRGDAFTKSFNPYLSRFLAGKNQNELKSKLLSLPETQPANSRERETIYLALIIWSKKLDPKFSASVSRKYAKEYKESIYAKRILKALPKLPPQIGDIALDFTLKSPEGVEIPLSSTKGKVVLLDFWASWCGPCRRENPNVVKTYHEYKDKGFTVFSVSLDKGAAKWKAAIAKDGLVWDNHVSDLKGWGSSAGKLYGVGSIPATFLIDQNGVVIAKNLRGQQLDKKLKELFGE